MPYGLKRADLQALAQAKLDDAQLLFEHARFSNSYYLAGYAVEIGLKACIARQVNAETIPDKYFLNNVLKHEFLKLIALAGLATALKEQQDRDPSFAAKWAIVSEWSPDARYESKDPCSAQVMLHALLHPDSGVFKWIRAYW